MRAIGSRPIIEMRALSKHFPGGVAAVDNVSLAIAEGEFFALLGPSGCGKTTLLRLLAGFEAASAGEIVIDGADMAGVGPSARPVNMVFQSYAVFPHMSVFDNVAYGLRVAGARGAALRAEVDAALDLVKLDGLGARMPEQLSGGQRQRVALARALVKRPRVLLLDEPLSALDAKLRAAMRLELTRLQKTLRITFVMVTHDQNEALSMADRVAVMEAGAIRQVASPADLYEAPANRFVADFIGQVNLMEGRVTALAGGGAVVNCGDACMVAAGHAPRLAMGQRCWVAIRPENIAVTRRAPANPGPNRISGTVAEIAYLGNHSTIIVAPERGAALRALRLNSARRRADQLKPGDKVWLSWSKTSPVILTE